MTLEEMRRIADARTVGKWRVDPDGNGIEVRRKMDYPVTLDLNSNNSPENLEFIVMASNNWDKLLKVVEIAKSMVRKNMHYDWVGKDPLFKEFEIALEELEKE